MSATLSTATSLERLLGTVEEAMTGEVVALQADTPADMACGAWSTRGCPGLRSSTAAAWWAW
jgi:hypothetical protein